MVKAQDEESADDVVVPAGREDDTEYDDGSREEVPLLEHDDEWMRDRKLEDEDVETGEIVDGGNEEEDEDKDGDERDGMALQSDAGTVGDHSGTEELLEAVAEEEREGLASCSEELGFWPENNASKKGQRQSEFCVL